MTGCETHPLSTMAKQLIVLSVNSVLRARRFKGLAPRMSTTGQQMHWSGGILERHSCGCLMLKHCGCCRVRRHPDSPSCSTCIPRPPIVLLSPIILPLLPPWMQGWGQNRPLLSLTRRASSSSGTTGHLHPTRRSSCPLPQGLDSFRATLCCSNCTVRRSRCCPYRSAYCSHGQISRRF